MSDIALLFTVIFNARSTKERQFEMKLRDHYNNSLELLALGYFALIISREKEIPPSNILTLTFKTRNKTD